MADVFAEEIPCCDEFSEAEEVILFESDGNTTAVTESMGEEEEFEWNAYSGVGEDWTPVHPIATLQKLVDSDVILDRQIAARNALDILSDVVECEDDVHSLVSLIFKLSSDSEFVVRVEMVSQVPQIAAFCREHENLDSVIRQQLVPLTVKYLQDHHTQVRKTSQAALLSLLEKGLVDDRQLTEWICPLVTQLVGNSNEDLKTEAISLMCKMAPIVGREILTKFFLEHFASFCSDRAFSIKQVCSISFGVVCKVAGTGPTEDILLPKFLRLCDDVVYEVRKNCVYVFMDVSSMVSRALRKEILCDVYVHLLCDDSRWVRLAAYQNLGAFISTFADPSVTGLQYCEDGTIEVTAESPSSPQKEWDAETQSDSTAVEESDFEKQSLENQSCDSVMIANEDPVENSGSSSDNDLIILNSESDQSNPSLRTENLYESSLSPCFDAPSSPPSNVAGDSAQNNIQCETELDKSRLDEGMADPLLGTAVGDPVSELQQKQNIEDSRDTDVEQSSTNVVHMQTPPKVRKDSGPEYPLTVVVKDDHLHVHVENETNFNNFQYWRVPIPDLELDIDIQDGRATSIHVRAKVQDEKSFCSSDLCVHISQSEMQDASGMSRNSSSGGKIDCMNAIHENSESNKPVDRRIKINSSYSETAVFMKPHGLNELFAESDYMCRRPCVEEFQAKFQLQCGSTSDSSLESTMSVHEQDMVPPLLLEYFINMVDNIQSQSVDVEMSRFCAHSFPAVVYTLGRKNWPCIRKLCHILSRDMQWKVRKTLASSLHQLGVMLGEEITSRELLPIFVSFLKDLDEVKIGILAHLTDFLKLLKPSDRRNFLPLTEEFIKMDNEMNWRYRCVLAEQLGPIVDFFSPSDVREHVVPIAMYLLMDRVCEVRLSAAKLMAYILRRLSQNSESALASWLITEINQKFRNESKWQWRQLYVFVCQQFAEERSLPIEVYVKQVVPDLLSLMWDAVPNVRLAVARCLAKTLLPLGYFPCIQRTHYQLLLQVMHSLQGDLDRDVKHFANVTAEAFSVLLQQKKQ